MKASRDAYRIRIQRTWLAFRFPEYMHGVAGSAETRGPGVHTYERTWRYCYVRRGILDDNGDSEYRADSSATTSALSGPGTYASLLITMQQCFSAGFIDPVIDAKKFENRARARQHRLCFNGDLTPTADNSYFNCFTWGWVAAHLNKDPLAMRCQEIGGRHSGFIEAREAYKYAMRISIRTTTTSPSKGIVRPLRRKSDSREQSEARHSIATRANGQTQRLFVSGAQPRIAQPVSGVGCFENPSAAERYNRFINHCEKNSEASTRLI